MFSDDDDDIQLPPMPEEMIPRTLGCVCRSILSGRSLCPPCALGISTVQDKINSDIEGFIEKAVDDFVNSSKSKEEWTLSDKLVLVRSYEMAWNRFPKMFDRNALINDFVDAMDLRKLMETLGRGPRNRREGH